MPTAGGEVPAQVAGAKAQRPAPIAELRRSRGASFGAGTGAGMGWAQSGCVFKTRSPSSAFYSFFGEGSPTKIDYRKKASLILTSLLEDLERFRTPKKWWIDLFVSQGMNKK